MTASNNTFSGGVTIDQGTLEIGTSSAVQSNINFAAMGGGTLLIDASIGSSGFGTIFADVNTFDSSDSLDFAGFDPTTTHATFSDSDGRALIVTNGTRTDVLDFTYSAPDFTGQTFYVAPDGTGGSIVSLRAHVPPSLSGTRASAVHAAAPGAATPQILSPFAVVTDPDSATLAGATISLGSSYLAGDVLTSQTNGTGITQTYASGVLTLSGVSSLANYETVIASVAYDTTASDPTGGGADRSRQVTFTLDDGSSNNSRSATVTETVTFTPTVAINSKGGLTDQQSQTISGTVDVANAGTTVVILDGSTQIGTALVQGDGSWTDPVNLLTGDGAHTIHATDTDAAGDTGISNAITFTLDTTPPAVVITSAGGLTEDRSQTISGTADVADAGTTVIIFDGSTQIGTAVVQGDGGWADGVDLLTGDGTHTISAADTDAAGNTGTSNAITFTLDTTPPAVAITSAGGLTDHRSETISGTADVGDAGTTVVIFDGSTQIGTAVVQSDGSWTDAVDLLTGNGDHFVSATDTDAAGNTGISNAITFTLNAPTTPPKIAIISVSGDDVVDGNEIKSAQDVHGTSDAIDQTVDVLIDGVEAGQAVVQDDGTWSTAISFASSFTGEHDVTAEVLDQNGNLGQADASVYVDQGYSFEQLSVGPNGEQGSGNSVYPNGVIFPSLSADGTKLAFTGLNFDLLSTAAGPDHAQVYVKDLTTGAISIVTPDPSADSEFGSLSPDGNLVAFVSKTNLDPTTHQNFGVPAGNDTYVVNLTTGAIKFRGYDAPDSDNLDNGLSTYPLPVTDNNTTAVPWQSGISTGIYASPSPQFLTGVYFAPGPSGYGVVQMYDPQLSDDGKIIAIEGVTHAELAPGPSGSVTQIYAGDWTANDKLALVSSFADGTPMPFGAYDPALSGDGKSVAFWAESPTDQWEVYVKNLTTGALTIASSDAAGTPETSDPGLGHFRTGAESIAISDDGRYVAFESEDTAFTGGSLTTIDLYVKDMVTGAIRQIALPPGAAGAEQLDMSADGSFLAFVSAAPLAASDTNGVSDIYGISLASLGASPPQIAIDAVTGDDKINAAEISKNVEVTGTSDAIGQTVTLAVDGNALPDVVVGTDGTWSTTIDATQLVDGVHQLRATVTGTDGATGSDGDLITVDRMRTAFDGYIVGGTVRYANGSANGATATTDASGNFSLSGGTGPLVMTGGTDSATGLLFTGTLEAPDGATVVSPLTTLVEKVIETSGGSDSVTEANDAVASALGLPAGIDLTTLDAVAGALSGDAAGTAAFKAGSQLLDVITLIQAAGGSPDAAYAAIVADVTAASGAGTTIDLTDTVTIEAIGQSAGLDAAAAQAVASIVSETSAAIEQQLAHATTPFEIFVDITGSSIAEQGDAASALSHAHDDAAFQQVADSYFQSLGTTLSHDDLIAADNVACYCLGTLIATDRGDVAVEELAIGDQVVTLSGVRPIKWIGRRSYGRRFAFGKKDILPICFKAGSLHDNLPKRDLWISPRHAMYLDGVLIEARDLVNGVSVIQAGEIERVDYFHIELESHDAILAEGAWSETFVDDDSRGMFHNAHEYRALFPDAPVGLAHYCGPRRVDGYEVEAARRRIDARAGLWPTINEHKLALRGYVDEVSPRRIAGWAQNVAHPEAPVCLDIYAGDRLIGQVLANRYREDLERAGLGSGRHSFEFTPPVGLVFTEHAVEVRRSIDDEELGRSHHASRLTVVSAAQR